MTTALPASLTVAIPASTPELTRSLSQQEIEEHRGRIALEVEIVLQGYWQAPLSVEMKGAVLADWCDELEDWPHESVYRALRKWRSEYPSRKPNPGHISAILKAERGRAWAKEQPKHEPEERGPRPTPEQAREILKRAGFRINEFGGVIRVGQ